MLGRGICVALAVLGVAQGAARAEGASAEVSATSDAPSTFSAERLTWSPRHPFSIGTRTGIWAQGYIEPGLGGHIRFQPWAFAGVELYADNFVGIRNGQMKKDLVNGFNLFFPLTRNRRWTVAPQLGMCDEFQVISPWGAGAQGPTVTDLLIAAHTGVQFEYRLGVGLAVEVAVDGSAYLGHSASVDKWTANLSDSLAGHLVAQTTAGINYYF